VEPTSNAKQVVPVADNFAELLQGLLTNLLSANFVPSKKHKEIVRYPAKNGVSVATTKGVCITASPLFCAERSQVIDVVICHSITIKGVSSEELFFCLQD